MDGVIPFSMKTAPENMQIIKVEEVIARSLSLDEWVSL